MAKATSTTVYDLAAAQITAKDSDKALKQLARDVKANANQWRNDVFSYETALQQAEDNLEALHATVKVSASDVLAAEDSVALAKRNLERIQELATARFGA